MLDLVLPKIECTESRETYGKFVAEPLEAGFGMTLGNALRRVLLNSLPGTAISSVKIDEVQHEFSAIPHIKEDTTEILLNLKGLRLRSFADRPAKLRVDFQGEGTVTAADIVAPADIEIVNPDLHIATLDSPDARLSMELQVERGKGYVPAGSQEGLAIGVIPVDAIYTPIRKVNYQVEHTRVGQVTNYDRLILEVWTDGSITPQEAVSQSAQILIRYLNLLVDLARLQTRQAVAVPGPTAIPQHLFETQIEDLDLSVRAYHCLKRSGITKIGQVLEMDRDDLLAVRNFGRKSLAELVEKLEQKGYLQDAAESRLAVSLQQPDPEQLAEGEAAPGDWGTEGQE